MSTPNEQTSKNQFQQVPGPLAYVIAEVLHIQDKLNAINNSRCAHVIRGLRGQFQEVANQLHEYRALVYPDSLILQDGAPLFEGQEEPAQANQDPS